MKSKYKAPKMHVRKGDIVEVVAGDDAAAGKTGKVLQVFPRESRALVEGVNLVKKCMRKTQDNPQGGIAEKEAPIAASNLRVVDAADRKKGKAKRK
jgi:large subunit ribosomal protein L24